jgi:VanZ family protein
MSDRYPWVPVAVYCAGIFVLSSIERPPDSISFLPDKLAHLILYAGLGFLTARGLVRTRGMKALSFRIFAALFALAYGITDEIHQHFVPGRTPELGDVAADAAGGLLGAFLFTVAQHRDYPADGDKGME